MLYCNCTQFDTTNEPIFLQKLAASTELSLHLTGSRLFGNPNQYSDWDWVSAPLTEAQVQILNNFGFEQEYPPQLFGGVQRVWHACHGTLSAHVLEVPNLSFRLRTQLAIAKFFPNGYGDKHNNAAGIWAMAELLVTQQIVLNKKLDGVALSVSLIPQYEQQLPLSFVTDCWDEENDFEWLLESGRLLHLNQAV